jgi:hypothetical protein
MAIDPREAADSLQDIAAVERRTREAMFYSGCSAIFILWGVLVACGYGATEFYPGTGRIVWPVIMALGCVATAAIIAVRGRARASGEVRAWRVVWAMAALAVFGVVWARLLGPVVPRPLMYAFQPSLFLLGIILAGLWLGRFFVMLGVVGIALIVTGFLVPEPWLRLWMAAVQSGTLILGGVWLGRNGVAR